MVQQADSAEDRELVATEFPVRYDDPEYQETHQKLFANSITHPLTPVLPPDTTQEVFDRALEAFRGAVGKDAVYIGKSLVDYIDPYELWEGEGRRKTPSAAVWWVE